MAQVSLSPEMWARIRHKAFDLGLTASKLVEQGMVEYLTRLDQRGEAAPEAISTGGSGKPPAFSTGEGAKPPARPAGEAPRVTAPSFGGPLPWDKLPEPTRPVLGDAFDWNDPAETEGTYVRRREIVDEALLKAWDRLDVTRVGRAVIVDEARRIRESSGAMVPPAVGVGAVLVPDPGAVPDAVRRVAAANPAREFHPVPKPGPRKKPSRRPGKPNGEAEP